MNLLTHLFLQYIHTLKSSLLRALLFAFSGCSIINNGTLMFKLLKIFAKKRAA